MNDVRSGDVAVIVILGEGASMDAKFLSEEVNEGIEKFRHETTPELTKLEAVEFLLREQLITLGILKPDEEPESWEVH